MASSHLDTHRYSNSRWHCVATCWSRDARTDLSDTCSKQYFSLIHGMIQAVMDVRPRESSLQTVYRTRLEDW